MFKIIEQAPGQPTDVVLGTQTLPAPSLVEDPDGYRWALLLGPTIPTTLWRWLIQRRPDALISGEHATPFDYARDQQTETEGAHRIPEPVWRGWSPGIEYRDLRMAMKVERPVEGFVHLHTHSEISALDGLSTIEEIVTAVVRDGNPAVAITDHGSCAAHPELQLTCDKYGVKPIFGNECYFVDDVTVKDRDYYHLVLWAMNDEGLRNLWALSTASEVDGKYYKPRIDWTMLERFHEGLLVSTACLRGPLLHPLVTSIEDAGREPEDRKWTPERGDPMEVALNNLDRLQGIFGDRLYVELHANQIPVQIQLNHWLVDLAQERGLPLVAVVDAHYAEPDHKQDHQVWLRIQTKKELTDNTGLFEGGHDYHMMTRDEVAKSLAYLGADVVDEAIANTVRVADRCTAKIVAKGHNPIFTRKCKEYPDAESRMERDVERMIDKCMARWDERTRAPGKPSQELYLDRFKTEASLIVKKGFQGYFMMVSDFVMYAKENRVWVGPGRGSGGGSLVAYLLGITEIDPVQYNLLFARFMTEGRTELPDFDIDFPTSKKQFMLDYVAQRWGADHIATVGTHTRLQSKGVIKDVARTLKSELPPDYGNDIEAVSKIITEAEASTAGLGMSWEDLWVQFGDLLEPYRERYPVVFQFAEKLRGRLKTYGAHAAGVVIDPDAPLTGALPLRMAGEGDDRRMVTQFDMNALTWMGYVKFDMLNLRTLDTLQQAADLVYESTGKWIHPYGWVDELLDPQVYEEISAGWTQGMFQIETSSGTRMCKRFRPESVVELADVITLVRPGPARSGLTDLYLNRKDGLEETYYPDPRMQEALKDRYGCLLYQEDVMATTMILAGYDGDEADKVRKILSKKKVEKVLEEGKKFVSRASENGMDSQAAKDLWEQIAEFAKYSFPQAHATAYAILGVWTGWFKVHYGLQYLTATLSTVKDERIPEFVEETRRIGYRVLPPDINVSGLGFTMDVASMAVRYGLASVKGVGDVAVNAILEARAEAPFVDFDDFLERKSAKCNALQVKILTRIGAFDTLVPNRAGLMGRLEAEKVAATGTDVCAWKGESKPIVWVTRPISAARRDELNAMDEQARAEALAEITARAESPLPCDYPWHSEPDKLGRSNKPEKRKAPPKKCTRGCRQFRPMDLPTVEDYPPFTDADIRKIEMDLLGVFLSSTPFDDIPGEVLTKLSTGVDVLSGEEGSYLLAGYVKSVRKKTDKTGKDYAFVTIDTPQGSIEAIIFSRAFSLYRDLLNPGSMSLMAVTKNSRGQNLTNMEALEFEEV